MTQDDIVVMAVNAGLVKWEVLAYKNELQTFAKLVANKERREILELSDSLGWVNVDHIQERNKK